MKQAERGVLLLCSSLGDEAAQPLTIAQFRELGRRVNALGSGGADPLRSLTAQDIVRLGYRQETAARICALLDREALLERYLLRAERAQVRVLTRLSPLYPAKLRDALGMSCPAVLFCKGDETLLARRCISVVGSRRLLPQNRDFAVKAGRLIAQGGFCLCSGGAVGADQAAAHACLASGGQTLIFPAGPIPVGPVGAGELFVCEERFDAPFSTPRALGRNRLIHAMGEKTLVAQTSLETGGTWQGTTDNLAHLFSPVFIFDDGSAGTRALIARGAYPVRELTDLSALEPAQMSF